jgi:two-component system alkaline phosphatase synthesis response regulator PhoP
LISKIKALLRRQSGSSSKDIPKIIKAGELIINRENYQVVYRGNELFLPRKEFELLSLLASKPGKVYIRHEILDKVWGNEVVVGGRTIDVHIRKLREKIGRYSIKTVKGVGYKFVI